MNLSNDQGLNHIIEMAQDWAFGETDDDQGLNRIIDMAQDWAFDETDDPLMPDPIIFSREAPAPLTVQSLPTEAPSLFVGLSSKKRPLSVVLEDLLGDQVRFQSHQTGQWAEKYEELVQYRNQTGHCLVPHSYQENPSLISWVKRQRYQHKLMIEGKPSTMTDERIQVLESIGFVWDSQGAAWSERLNELAAFRDTYKHCNIPCNYEGNPQLATWVKCQRRQYKLMKDGKPSSLTPFRLQGLDQLGFEWEIRAAKRQRRC
jgi:hypothetical protein